MSDFPDEATRAEVDVLLSHPLHFPDEFKRWLGDFVTTNIPMIPFSHIFGAKVNIAKSGVYIATAETAPATWGNCTTVGPEITGLADGRYVIAFGHRSRAEAAPSYNGAAPNDDDRIYANESGPATARLIVKTLQNNNNNSVLIQYQGSRTTQDRWLVVIRVGAPGE